MAKPGCGALFLCLRTVCVLMCLQAPVAEEFAFRACMCPLLLDAGYSEAAVVFSCPLYFGVHQLPPSLCCACAEAPIQALHTSTMHGSCTSYAACRFGTPCSPQFARECTRRCVF